MKRRDLIVGGGAVVLGGIARAQTPRRYRLGIFWWGERADMWGGNLQRILDELGRLGYVRGVRLEVYERYTNTEKELDQFARQFAAMPVDAIVTIRAPKVS